MTGKLPSSEVLLERVEHRKESFVLPIGDGSEAKVLYRMNEGVPEQWRGHGLADIVALAAFQYAKFNRQRVLPSCSYLAKWVQHHDEFSSVVVDGTKDLDPQCGWVPKSQR